MKKRKTNRTYKRLSIEKIDEAKALYELRGWKLLWIAKELEVDHTSIMSLIKRKGFIRQMPILEKRPPEIEAMYRRKYREKHNLPDDFDNTYFNQYTEDDNIHVKSYSDIIKEAHQKRAHSKDTECSHPFWVKKCSFCNTILESDVLRNEESSTEPIKVIYNEFDKLVCSYQTALDLQALGILQQSIMYWVYYETLDSLTIRIKTNLPERTNENALIASAFTSQELFKVLLKLNNVVRTDNFMRKLALNGSNPTYLGKLLCRNIRKIERI